MPTHHKNHNHPTITPLPNLSNLSYIESILTIKTHLFPSANLKQLFNHITIQTHACKYLPKQPIQSYTHTQNHITLHSNLLGLYGLNGPLPLWHTQAILTQHQNKNPLKAWYTLLNQPNHHQYTQAHFKYQLSSRILHNQEHNLLNIFYAFIGYDHTPKPSKHLCINTLLENIPILAHTIASSQGLSQLLSNLLHTPITIKEMQPSHHPIQKEQQTQLGSNHNQLGQQTHLGHIILTYNHTIEIQLHNLTHKQFHHLTTHPKGIQSIQPIIQHYLKDSTNTRITYTLQTPLQGIQLDNNQSATLGHNTFLTQAPSQTITHPI